MTSSPTPHVFAANLQGVVDIHCLHLLFSHSLSHPLWPCSDLLLYGDCFVQAIRDPMWVNPTVSFQSSSYLALQQRLTQLFPLSSSVYLLYLMSSSSFCLRSAFWTLLIISVAGSSFSGVLMLGTPEFRVFLSISAHSFGDSKLKKHRFLDLLVTTRFVLPAQTSLSKTSDWYSQQHFCCVRLV